MSALPPKADITVRVRHDRFVPKAAGVQGWVSLGTELGRLRLHRWREPVLPIIDTGCL